MWCPDVDRKDRKGERAPNLKRRRQRINGAAINCELQNRQREERERDAEVWRAEEGAIIVVSLC